MDASMLQQQLATMGAGRFKKSLLRLKVLEVNLSRAETILKICQREYHQARIWLLVAISARQPAHDSNGR